MTLPVPDFPRFGALFQAVTPGCPPPACATTCCRRGSVTPNYLLPCLVLPQFTGSTIPPTPRWCLKMGHFAPTTHAYLPPRFHLTSSHLHYHFTDFYHHSLGFPTSPPPPAGLFHVHCFRGHDDCLAVYCPPRTYCSPYLPYVSERSWRLNSS